MSAASRAHLAHEQRLAEAARIAEENPDLVLAAEEMLAALEVVVGGYVCLADWIAEVRAIVAYAKGQKP